MKQYAEVWEALLPEMGLMAVLRNLGKMTEVGLLGALSDAERLVVSRLERAEALRAARVHPLQILVALNTYAQGHGEKGKLTWKPRRRKKTRFPSNRYWICAPYYVGASGADRRSLDSYRGEDDAILS